MVAAVQNGADAVYMGFGGLNARRSARNFTDEEFRAAVAYCHPALLQRECHQRLMAERSDEPGGIARGLHLPDCLPGESQHENKERGLSTEKSLKIKEKTTGVWQNQIKALPLHPLIRVISIIQIIHIKKSTLKWQLKSDCRETDVKAMRSIQLLLQMQEHHVMVDLLKKLVLTTLIPILPQ